MPGVEVTKPVSKEELDVVSAKANEADVKATQALSDMLTGADRQQPIRIQVTPDANGKAVITYPKPYVAGTKPIVQAIAETPDGVSYRNDVGILENSANSTQVTLILQRLPKTIVATVLGGIINLISPITTPVWVNVFVRAA